MTIHQRRYMPARGNRVSDSHRSIAIRFDVETFDIIRARAVAKHTGFAEQVRILVERALSAEQTELQRKRA